MAILVSFFFIFCSLLVPAWSSSRIPSFTDTHLDVRHSVCCASAAPHLAWSPVHRFEISCTAFRTCPHNCSLRDDKGTRIISFCPSSRNPGDNRSPPSSASAPVYRPQSSPSSSSRCYEFSATFSSSDFLATRTDSILMQSPRIPAIQPCTTSFLPSPSLSCYFSPFPRNTCLSFTLYISRGSAVSSIPTSSVAADVSSGNLTPLFRPYLSPLYLCSSPTSVVSTRLNVYRNKVRHINPVRRVKHLRRNSGQSHVHELARERYLLHRQKDVRDYCRLRLSPHQHMSPASCPHSQRNAAIKHPFRGVNKARKKEFARLNREDDIKDESRIQALKAFLDEQNGLMLQTQGAEKALPTSSQHEETEVNSRVLGEKIVAAYAELQQLLEKRRMLRPLGSNKLFICNVDGRLANSDLEDFFDFFFDQTRVRLHKNADGSHRGSGIIRFTNTLQATHCLLEFNGVQLGEKKIFLAEALGPPLKKKERKTYPRPPFPNGIPST